LDQERGAWWRELEATRRTPAVLAFTSDHGEAFFEHEELGHGGPPWEEKIRIPMFLRGPGIEPRAVSLPPALGSLPVSLCVLAGIPPPPGFEGKNLLALDGARDGYCFVRIGEQPM